MCQDQGHEPARAKDLYRSSLWFKRRAFAECSGLPWVILSAEHGVLDPNEIVAPHDRYLRAQPAHYRAAWGQQVVTQLVERFGPIDGMTFALHAGRSYGDPIEGFLRERGAVLLRPLDGLTQGRHLTWYDQQDTEPAGDRRPAVGHAPRPSSSVL